MADRQLPELTNRLTNGVLLPAVRPKTRKRQLLYKKCKIDGTGIGVCVLHSGSSAPSRGGRFLRRGPTAASTKGVAWQIAGWRCLAIA